VPVERERLFRLGLHLTPLHKVRHLVLNTPQHSLWVAEVQARHTKVIILCPLQVEVGEETGNVVVLVLLGQVAPTGLMAAISLLAVLAGAAARRRTVRTAQAILAAMVETELIFRLLDQASVMLAAGAAADMLPVQAKLA